MRSAPWSFYLLLCADGSLYCGISNDVDERLVAHLRGRVKYTRGRLPVILAHLEAAGDRGAALRREHAWKRLRRAEKLARLAHAPWGLSASAGGAPDCPPPPPPARRRG